MSRLVDPSSPASDSAIADKVAQAQRDAAKFSKPFTVLIHEQDPSAQAFVRPVRSAQSI